MAKYIKLISFTILLMANTILSSAQKAKNVILFMIDGLHWEAPTKLKMPNFNSLIKNGTYIEKSYVIVPHHPTIGDYSKYNSCSFPNPMLHAGTIFVNPENKMIQEMISPKKQTAFVVNTYAYRSVASGFTTKIMDPTLTDDEVVQQAIHVLENQNPAFMRVHLQTPGEKGRSVSECDKNEPFFRNIYGKNSPYIKAIENADKLLGEFISHLKKSGKWENTVLIVTSDHGQSKVGWHPMYEEDSWTTPMVFAGKNIASKRKLSYFEHTNLAPTIAWLLGVEKPNKDGGSGEAIKEISTNSSERKTPYNEYIKTINKQIKTFNFYKSSLILGSEKKPYYALLLASLENEFLTPEPFYHQDRIMDWSKAKTTKHMIEANEKILKRMKDQLEN